jgi:hypothetical protein
MVEEFLNDAPRFQLYRAELGAALADWQTSGASLDPIIDRSPALKEIKPLAKNLSDVGETGMEAVSYLKMGTSPPGEWRDTSLAKLDEAAKPYGALEFVVIPSVRKLVMAAAELPQLRKMTQAEWREHIKKLATK